MGDVIFLETARNRGWIKAKLFIGGGDTEAFTNPTPYPPSIRVLIVHQVTGEITPDSINSEQ